MPIFRLTHASIEPLSATSFADRGLKERNDLQRLLKANIAVVADDVLVIAEEFAEWDDSRRRIDLLAVDRAANIVVFELKRDNDGGHMELQSVRYAAMVSSMTFERATDAYQAYLDNQQHGQDARERLLEFLEWDVPREEDFGRDVRIVLVAGDFSKEITTTVLWLNERDLDIRCVRMKPYVLGDELVIDVQQVVPLPEAQEYQVRVREKAISQRESARHGGEDTGCWFMNTGDRSGDDSRSWDDCRRYGYMSAGGGKKWVDAIRRLRVGDKLFAYLSGSGYVGYGEVIAEAVRQSAFTPPGQKKRLLDLPTSSIARTEPDDDPERCEWCAAVRWIRTVDRDAAVLKNRSYRATLVRIRQPDLVAELLTHFAPEASA